ncbi:hypothetical protein BASA60_007066 [Batrachochytrium salamandrivorans]|nr:hypothetical protein BASA60_007066 [Batrachochytrium salamandrivorans]
MEYPGEDWVVLDEYLEQYGKLFVNEVRPLIKKVIKVSLSLKKFGIAHGCVTESNVLYNKDTGGVKLMNFGFSGPLEGCNQGSSAKAEYSVSASGSAGDSPDSGPTEIGDIKRIGYFLNHILTWGRTHQTPFNRNEGFVKGLKNKLDNPESQLAINAVDLVAILLNYCSYKMSSIENILDHPFFTSQ